MYRSYLRLKGCPKCGGDVLVDHAMDDEDVCLQCGFRKPLVAAASRDYADRPNKRAVVAGGRAHRRS